MEQSLTDLLRAAQVTQDTVDRLQQMDVLTLNDLIGVRAIDLPDLGLGDGELTKLIWVQEFVVA